MPEGVELCQDPNAEGIHGTEILQINEEEINEILLRIRNTVWDGTEPSPITTLELAINLPA